MTRLDKLSEAKTAFERDMVVYGTQMRFLQLMMYSGDSISELMLQIRLARKLAQLERQIVTGEDRER